MKTSKKVNKKRKLSVSNSPTKEPEIKKSIIFNLLLTKFELLHLRDLMSIILPPDGLQTVSQALANVEDRLFIESVLWNKLSKLCNEAQLPIGSEAPDYIIAPSAQPSLGVFQVNHDLESAEVPEAGFLPVEEEDKEKELIN